MLKELVLRSYIRKIIKEEFKAINLGLELAGLIPGIGEFADAANMVIYAKDGDYLNAALSAISMIPTIGDLIGKSGKLAVWVAKIAPEGSRAAKLAPEIVEKIKRLKDLIGKNKILIDKLFLILEKDEEINAHIPKMREALKAFLGSEFAA
jgi:hypothetical protein